MNIQHLVKMANEIGDYFAAYPDRERAVRDVAAHLKKFWDPRMRAQIIEHVRDRQGEGLTDIARVAVQQLAAAPDK